MRALLALALLAAPTAAQSPARTPAHDPAPFARSETQTRYWPVITDAPDARIVPALFADGSHQGRALRRFHAPRPAIQADNPTRRHVGIDLTARAGDAVVAIENGAIVAFYPFLAARTGEMTWAILIDHGAYVAAYGEVRATSLTANNLQVGSVVRAGRQIGEISDTAQLHFEAYTPGTTRSRSWAHGGDRPQNVLDPTNLLLDLAAQGLDARP